MCNLAPIQQEFRHVGISRFVALIFLSETVTTLQKVTNQHII